MGRMHGNFIRKRMVGGFPTVAGMTNYQEGVPGGTTGWDYSAGTLYTVTSVNGRVETITARVIHIYPVPSFEEEMTVLHETAVPYQLLTCPGLPEHYLPDVPCHRAGHVACSAA
jgi:hypothetical protein